MKLKSLLESKNDSEKKEKIDILKLFKQDKRNIPVAIFSIMILIVVFFMFNKNGGKDIVRPNTNNNSIEQNQGLINSSEEIKEYDFTEAMDHIGEKARVKGEVLRVFTAKSGVTFLDFCEDWNDCPFSAVIFASDLKKFPDVNKYERKVIITGTIKSYNGKAEIILKSPEQVE